MASASRSGVPENDHIRGLLRSVFNICSLNRSGDGLAAYVAFTGSSPETPTCRQVNGNDGH